MAFAKAQMDFFARYIEENLGVVFTDANYFQLQTRLEQVMGSMGIQSEDELWTICRGGIVNPLKALLLDTATNNETSFFRDKHIFDTIRDSLLPELGRRSSEPRELRIWSAACSTGQEPYSIAMAIGKAPNAPKVEIFATDFSERVLNFARAGVYSHLQIQRGLPAALMVRYFEKQADDSWKVKPELQENIRFKQLHLLEDWPAIGSFDLVLCRNVLIYHNEINKKAVIKKIHGRLTPGGYLVLGAAESLLGLSTDFETVSIGKCLVHRKK